MNEDATEIIRAFKKAVNMAPAQLERWLESRNARSVGIAKGQPKTGTKGGESVGHKSGRRIVELKRKRKADFTAADYAHMKKVVGYVARHMKQRPAGDVRSTRWRYSLMNWGHDPMKL